jgi:hypothetical integral membrane protein (TIGR02206 family)
VGTPVAYWVSVTIGALGCAALCTAARRRPGPWVALAGRVLCVVLALDAIGFVTVPLVDGDWSVRTSLPFALCDVALVVAAVACYRPRQLTVELTYFWGLAGTLQAVLTPDLSVGFPHLEFFEYVVGHVGIVTAALYLVIGRRQRPRRGSVPRVFAITAAYTALVGGFDWLTGANYMFLAALPSRTSLLSFLGPWPWYVVSAAGVALAALVLLDLPFRVSSRNPTWSTQPRWR